MTISKLANQTVKVIKTTTTKAVKRVKATADALIHGRDGYGPVIQKFLNTYGDAIITKIQIIKNPVHKLAQGALDVISNDKVSDLPFDRLFHLSMNLTTNKGTLNIEKNQFINMRAANQQVSSGGEFRNIQTVFNVSLNSFLENGIKSMGNKRYFNYNASSSNCQDWVMGLLHGNSVNDASVDSFVKQDASKVFDDPNKNVRKFTNSVIELGKVADIVMSGGGT